MIIDNLQYKIYSISDLRDWLLYNVQNGLSETAITPTRAHAFTNNPHAKDDDAAVEVVFDANGKTVGYTAFLQNNGNDLQKKVVIFGGRLSGWIMSIVEREHRLR